MKARINAKKKSSVNKKLIPAAGSLLISAAMLGTSTFAWFTMSREVEVKNIQMTATTPEDIQLSLGKIGSNATTAVNVANSYSLKAGTGVLVGANTTASDGQVATPTTNAWDWSNTADITNYYTIGKLIPASSTDGAKIYFTPDADGVGQTIKSGAEFIRADSTVNGAAGVADSGSSVGYKTSLFAYTDPAAKTVAAWGTYSGSTAYNKTYDDGYYVDIPVWLRTSSTVAPNISVMAYVKPQTDTTLNASDEALYRAVRVAILNTDQESTAGAVTPSNLLPVADGMTGITSSSSGTLSSTPFGGTSILNWYNHSGTVAKGETVSQDVAADTAGNADQRFDADLYSPASIYTGSKVVTLTPRDGSEDYGVASKLIIRVWLEGEDPDCWNDTAGQDWSINLKFYKTEDTPSNSDIETLTTP